MEISGLAPPQSVDGNSQVHPSPLPWPKLPTSLAWKTTAASLEVK